MTKFKIGRQKVRRKRTYAPAIPSSVIEIQGQPVNYKEIWGRIEEGLKGIQGEPEEILLFKEEVDDYKPNKNKVW